MDEAEISAAIRTAGEIVNRAVRGVPDHMLMRGIKEKDVATAMFCFLKTVQAVKEAVPLMSDDDPLEPHPDPMRK
jgi:methionine aminopeptidase